MAQIFILQFTFSPQLGKIVYEISSCMYLHFFASIFFSKMINSCLADFPSIIHVFEKHFQVVFIQRKKSFDNNIFVK